MLRPSNQVLLHIIELRIKVVEGLEKIIEDFKLNKIQVFKA